MPLLEWLTLHTFAGMTIGALEAGQFQLMATLVFSGLLVGVAQWLVLRQVLRHSARWILASAIGWIVGVQLMIGLGGLLDPIVTRFTELSGWEVFWLNVTQQPIALLGMGIAQSVLLRSLRAQTDEWLPLSWVGVSVLGGAVQGGGSAMFCAVFCPTLTEPLGGILTTAIVYGVGWFGYSFVTAALLGKLLSSSVSGHS
jgi:hypothetical protein